MLRNIDFILFQLRGLNTVEPMQNLLAKIIYSQNSLVVVVEAKLSPGLIKLGQLRQTNEPGLRFLTDRRKDRPVV